MVSGSKRSFWELTSSTTKEIVLVVVDSAFSALKKSDLTVGGMRVYRDGYVGIQGLQGEAVNSAWMLMQSSMKSSVVQPPETLASLETSLASHYSQAVDMLDLKIEFDGIEAETWGSNYELSSEANSELRSALSFAGAQARQLETAEFIALTETFLNEVKTACPDFKLSNKIKWVERQEKIINTEGLEKSWSDAWLEMELLFVHQDEKNIYSGSFETRCRDFDKAAMEVLAATLKDLLKAYHKPVSIQEGCWPVIFFEDEYSLMQYFMIHLSGRNWASGTSALKNDFKGSPFLNVEFSRLPESFLPSFDACGATLKTGKVELISEGVVVKPYADCMTAKREHLEATASTWAAYDGVPGFGYMPLRLSDPRQRSLNELLSDKANRQAILVFTTGGGEYGSDGTFTAPVQLAYLMEQGEVVGKLPQIAVSSNVNQLFGTDYVGVTCDSILPGMNRRGIIAEMQVHLL